MNEIQFPYVWQNGKAKLQAQDILILEQLIANTFFSKFELTATQKYIKKATIQILENVTIESEHLTIQGLCLTIVLIPQAMHGLDF